MSSKITIEPDQAEFARLQLLNWYKTSARTFPWRDDHNPYHVLMAEMMLRRTQARQVVPVYHEFLCKYPDVYKLDQASSKDIANVLYPLGLSWRAGNFKILANEIVTKYNGQVPRDSSSLLSLTGVGPYVAAAVQSFAFNEVSVIADTNTVRVAGRYFGFDYTPESRRRKDVIKAISYLVDQQEAAHSNYALLDFAATVCRAREPIHDGCPLNTRCAYYQNLMKKQDQVFI